METTKALISKLVQTKSIERALAPIATQRYSYVILGYETISQEVDSRTRVTLFKREGHPTHPSSLITPHNDIVSQLVIQNEAYDEGETDAFPADPVVTATEVKQSVDQLVNIANRLTAETTDEELKSQMPKASEGLEVSGCELVISARRILVEKFRPESRRHFIRIAKDVLERTLKVLLVTDDAEVRRILHSAEGLRRRMQALTAVDSTKTMVNAFKNFTESLMLLSSLTERRQKDIANPRQQERIMSSMAVMRKCAPMLSAALQMHVKYPHNTQAQASKDYVIGQILDSLDDLMHAIENQSLDGDDDDDEQGSFVSLIDTIARLLTSDDLSHIGALDNDLEASIESAVRHSMAVAHLSVEPHRSLLIKNCHRILKERGSVAEMGKQLRRGLSEMADVESDLREACMILLAECQDLERHVNASLLQLFVDVFKETTEPVDRMVKAAFESNVASVKTTV
ncbi:hypothetical protein CAPTEDRAFT_195498 [Capitella teleta]|uniref:Uncharacterized protein n=1 Tax=Capitella teleta TaxID=283909 RepID=R7V4P1_CAPTE|nr:hypothetical protein CAPTEDRAFT_195498 [Capitella teleta]|eukprot:ELU13813.1 hypothetical protein CAPTEDRAFT_195498 [Capitella teleta]